MSIQTVICFKLSLKHVSERVPDLQGTVQMKCPLAQTQVKVAVLCEVSTVHPNVRYPDLMSRSFRVQVQVYVQREQTETQHFSRY